MPDAFMCTWKKSSDELENTAKENFTSVNLTYKSTIVPDMFLIKSWWQGVTTFAYFTFFKIHFMLFILSFHIVICLSVALQKSPILPGPDPYPDLQLYSGHFELLKTQTLQLCKSLGNNKKKCAEGRCIIPFDRQWKILASESQLFLLFKHCRFAVQGKQPILLPASCPHLLCASLWSAPSAHRMLSSDDKSPILIFSVFSESSAQENKAHWPSAIAVISLYV